MEDGKGLLGSLEAVAAELTAQLPRHRVAAVACEAASATLGAPVLVAPPDEAGRAGQSLVALPIPPTGRQLGVMLVDRRLTRDEQAYLGVLTALLGLALGRAKPAGSHLLVGDIEIDLGEQRVVIGDREARLTPSEIRLLTFLAEDPGRARTRREILRHLWHCEHIGDERACDAHISNLRRKIERDPSRPERVVTVRSVGYALRSKPGM